MTRIDRVGRRPACSCQGRGCTARSPPRRRRQSDRTARLADRRSALLRPAGPCRVRANSNTALLNPLLYLTPTPFACFCVQGDSEVEAGPLDQAVRRRLHSRPHAAEDAQNEAVPWASISTPREARTPQPRNLQINEICGQLTDQAYMPGPRCWQQLCPSCRTAPLKLWLTEVEFDSVGTETLYLFYQAATPLAICQVASGRSSSSRSSRSTPACRALQNCCVRH